MRMAAMREKRKENSYSELTLPGPSHFPAPYWLNSNKKPEGRKVLFCRRNESTCLGREEDRDRWGWA